MTTPAEHELPDEVDEQILAETRRIYRQWLGIAEPETIAAEATRLHELAEEQAQLFREQMQQEWTDDWPPVERKARQIRSAWIRGRSMVLEDQLYPQVTPEVQAEVEQMDAWLTEQASQKTQRLREARDPNRWKTLDVDVTDLARRIVRRVWPIKPAEFTPLATALIQQRLEDNERTPTVPEDPIAPVLEQMIEEQVAATPEDQLPF